MPLSHLDYLEQKLLKREHIVETRNRVEIKSTVEWLVRHRRPGGYWGDEDLGATALAAIALAGWRVPIDVGGIRVKPGDANYPELDLTSTFRWLAEQATPDGAYPTPWYSAVVLQSFAAADLLNFPAAQKTLAHLRGLDPLDDQRWAQDTHHAAKILESLILAGEPRPLLDIWSQTVKRNIKVSAGAYVCGQALHSLLLLEGAVSADVEFVIEYLASYLKATKLTLPSFLDSLPALQALAMLSSTRPELRELVLDKGRELFSKHTLRNAWYSSAWYTAQALVVLHGVDADRQIIIERIVLDDAFATAKRDLPKKLRRAVRQTCLLTALFMGLVFTLIEFIEYGLLSNTLVSLVLGLVGSPVLIWNIIALYKELTGTVY
jgi:hypothetical protein